MSESESKPISIVMCGTGDFALPTFRALRQSPLLRVVGLITQPDRPQGRKQELIPSAIKLDALEHGVSVFQPESINAAEGLEIVRSLAPDLIVTAAYGQILSGELLGIPRLGGINLHGSILPKYRGAAPVARAIQAGETEAGVTVIRMTPKIDAGGMIAIARTPIDPDETAGELEDRLAALGAPLVVETIAEMLAGRAEVIPQDKALVTKAPKLSKDDARIDWTQPARRVHDHVRAMRPWPMTSTSWYRAGSTDSPTRLIVHRTEVLETETGAPPGTVVEAAGDRFVVACGSGAIRLLEVQLVGKKPLGAAEFLRGHKPLGDRLAD
ncbi:MAG: methionyl-tRNA formyltransferase [Isosphaeraceae bacterium]|nr:methionyl-tRNA formyltransferase [Isosphaeraceae bacterium]